MADRRRMDPRALGLSEEELRQLGFSVRGKARAEAGAPVGLAPAPVTRRRLSPALSGWLATTAVLAVTGWAAVPERRLPPPVPAAGPDTAFSAARAMAQLVELAQRPHPSGSPEHERVRERLVARLAGLGLEAEVQTAVSAVREAASVRAATVRNVVARIPGSASAGSVALVAHYDGAPLSPGAADNAMGVAAVLEVARALTAGNAPRNDILIVLTDGGAVGGLGARAFVREHPSASALAAAVVVDVMGGAGAAIAFDASAGGRDSPSFAHAVDGPGSVSLARALLGVDTHPELVPFREAGVATVALTSLGDRRRRHQPDDVAAEISEATLQDLGAQLLAITRAAAEADPAATTVVGAEAAVSLSLPLVGAVRYGRGQALLVGGGILTAWVLLLALLIRARGASGRRLGAGAGVALAVVVASATLARLLYGWAGGRHPELGALDTALHSDGVHIGAAAALALACGSAAHAVARRWCRSDELIVGALALPVVGALWVTLAHPAASAAVQWPLAAALVGAVVVTLAGPSQWQSTWARVAVVLVSVPLMLTLVPALALVADVWTFRRAAGLGALLGVAALLLLPVLDGLRRPRVWLTPAVAIATTAALVVVVLPSVRGGAAHPVPSALVYLADRPAPSLLPAGAPVRAEAAEGGARRMSGEWLLVPGPGERWARSWVVDPPTGSTDPGVLLLPGSSAYEIGGSGPESLLVPPHARLLDAKVEGMRRRARIAIRSGLGGELVGVRVDDATGASLTRVGDVGWEGAPAPVRTLTHWGRPVSGEILLELTLPAERAEVELLVLEHHLRPREILVEGVFERPDSLAPNQAAGSDRVIQRTIVRVPLAAAAAASE